MPRPWSLAVVLFALGASLPARSVLAQTTADAPTSPHRIDWDPSWPKFSGTELGVTGLLAGVAVGSLAIPYGSGRWRSTNGFDTAARSALRLPSQEGRDRAQDVSDLLLAASVNYLFVDAAVVTWWGYGRGSVAFQMTLIDIETLAVTLAATSLVKGIAARERPYREECTGPIEHQDRDCQGVSRYDSFFSGHTSTTFAAAGLTCQHHAHLPLYGGGVPDALACAASFALAGTTGALRVLSDRHWMSDVLTGAAVGTIAGLSVPWVLHYRPRAPASPRSGGERSDTLSVQLVPAPMGGSLVGAF